MSVVLYAHFRADDGIMFYIGIGSADRSRSDYGRSDWWERVVDKHGYVAKVLQVGLTRAEAQELERVMIAEFRSEAARGIARLVNITDGGDGGSGDLWRGKNLEGVRRRSENPEWQVMMTERNRRLSEGNVANPEWHKRYAESRLKMMANPEWRANRAAAAARTPYQQRLHLFELLETDEAKAMRRLRRWDAKYMGWEVA